MRTAALGFLLGISGVLAGLLLVLLWAFSQMPEVEHEIRSRHEQGIYGDRN